MRVSDTSTSSPATRLMREAAAAVTVSSARSSSPSAAAVEGLRALGGAATAAAAEGQQQQQAAPSASAFSISAAAGFGSGQAADGLLSSLAVPRISVRASSATQLLQAHTIATGLPPRSPGGKALLQGNFFQRISSALPPEGGGGGNVSRLHSTSTTSATGGLPFPASAPQHQSNAATSGMRGSSSPTHSSRSSPLSNTAQLRASLASASATAAVSSGSVRRSSGSGVGGGGGGGGTTLRRSFSLQAEMDAAASDGPSLRRPSVPTLPSSALLVATGSRAKRVSSTGQVPDHSILRQVPAAVPPSTSLPTGDAAATVSALMARTLALPELAGGNGPASAPTSPARGGASGSIMIAQPSPSRRVSIASSGGGSSQGRLGDHYGTLTALRNSQFPSSLGSYPDDGSALMANEDAASVAAASGGGGEAASPPTRTSLLPSAVVRRRQLHVAEEPMSPAAGPRPAGSTPQAVQRIGGGYEPPSGGSSSGNGRAVGGAFPPDVTTGLLPGGGGGTGSRLRRSSLDCEFLTASMMRRSLEDRDDELLRAAAAAGIKQPRAPDGEAHIAQELRQQVTVPAVVATASSPIAAAAAAAAVVAAPSVAQEPGRAAAHSPPHTSVIPPIAASAAAAAALSPSRDSTVGGGTAITPRASPRAASPPPGTYNNINKFFNNGSTSATMAPITAAATTATTATAAAGVPVRMPRPPASEAPSSPTKSSYERRSETVASASSTSFPSSSATAAIIAPQPTPSLQPNLLQEYHSLPVPTSTSTSSAATCADTIPPQVLLSKADARKLLGSELDDTCTADLPGYSAGKVIGEGGFCKVRKL